MFSVRIHSLDSPVDGDEEPAVLRPSSAAGRHSPADPAGDAAGGPDEAPGTSSRNPHSNPNPNLGPRFHFLCGILHLYRNLAPPSATSSSSSPSSSSFNPPPASDSSHLHVVRSTLLLILAVPGRLSSEDFLRFCGPSIERASLVRIIRNDGIEDRYSVLVEFDDQKGADALYHDLNGWGFPTEGEVCHVLFIGSLEYTESMEIAGTPPVGSTELPTCPVCIERLDQDISGIIATSCDHSFQCSCISKWANSSCSVCQFCQKHSEKPACSICEASENLWICVICGFVGCGRYKEGHSIRHWKDTEHCYSLDIETQRVWDYVGDSYVHRLNHSRSDDKLANSKFICRSIAENCESCACTDDSGIDGAIFSSRIEAIKDEYNHLLESQLESQRQYYDVLLQEEMDKREKYIAVAVEKAVNMKIQEFQQKIANFSREIKIVAETNENLMKSQNIWKEKIQEITRREKETLKLKDEKIHELEEEIRDYTVFIEAQKKLSIADADDIRGGTLLPVQSPTPPPPPPKNAKRSSKSGRKRN